MDIKISRPLLVITKAANGSVAINRFVDYEGAECGNNEPPLGISINSVVDGEVCPIATHGIVGVELSGTVAAGDPVGIALGGFGKPVFGSDVVAGRALAAGESGDIIPINMITP